MYTTGRSTIVRERFAVKCSPLHPLLVALAAALFGATAPRSALAAPQSGAPPGADLAGIVRSTARLKGSIGLSREARASMVVEPSVRRCAALLSTLSREEAAWIELEAAYATASPAADPVAHAHSALAMSSVRAGVSGIRLYQADVASHCERLPPSEEGLTDARALEVSGLARCGEALIVDEAVVLRLKSLPMGGAAASPMGLAVLRFLIPRLEHLPPVVFVVVDDRLRLSLPASGLMASVFSRRAFSGTEARLLSPATPGTSGMIVLPAASGLEDGPSLRQLVAVYASGLAVDRCVADAADGWGASDVAGQLGGFPGAGRLDARPTPSPLPVKWQRLGQRGNGGNIVPFAPFELYLMGLEGAEAVPPMTFSSTTFSSTTFSSTPRPCALNARDVQLPVDSLPDARALDVLLVVMTDLEVKGPEFTAFLAAQLRAFRGFVAAGPDRRVDRLNFFEATGGRGRLMAVSPRFRDGPCSRLNGAVSNRHGEHGLDL